MNLGEVNLGDWEGSVFESGENIMSKNQGETGTAIVRGGDDLLAQGLMKQALEDSQSSARLVFATMGTTPLRELMRIIGDPGNKLSDERRASLLMELVNKFEVAQVSQPTGQGHALGIMITAGPTGAAQ